jgi:hypothetical protein
MIPPRAILSAASRARGRLMSTMAAPRATEPAMPSAPLFRNWLVHNKGGDMVAFAALLATGAWAVRAITRETMAWQTEIAEVKRDVENLATKESLARVEAEVKSLATKESVAKLETELRNVLQSARLEGQNAALKAWMEMETSVAVGQASKE